MYYRSPSLGAAGAAGCAECSGWVAQSVLADCAGQTLAISLAEARAPGLISRHERWVGDLESGFGVDRRSAGLPGRKELAARAASGRGLVRPEIAMLLAYSKNVVVQELLNSEVPDDAVFSGVLANYFPERIRLRCPDGVTGHRLAREITATELADRLVNHVGPGFLYRLEERLGIEAAATPRVAIAYVIVHAVFGVDDVWARDNALRDGAPMAHSTHLLAVQVFIEKAVSWILRNRPLALNPAAEIGRYAEPIAQLLCGYPIFGADGTAVPQPMLAHALELADIAAQRELSIGRVAETYFAIADELDLPCIREGVERALAADYWESMAAAAIRYELADKLCRLVNAVLASRIR